VRDRDSFIFYRSFFEAAEELGDPDFGQLMRAVCSYALYGRAIDLSGFQSSLFKLIKPQLDANQRRYENSLKGGAPKGNKNAAKKKKTTEKQPTVDFENNQKTTKKQPNENDNVNENENDNVNDNDNDIAVPADAAKKTVKVECKNGNVIDVDLNGDRISRMVTEAMTGKPWEQILKEAE